MAEIALTARLIKIKMIVYSFTLGPLKITKLIKKSIKNTVGLHKAKIQLLKLGLVNIYKKSC